MKFQSVRARYWLTLLNHFVRIQNSRENSKTYDVQCGNIRVSDLWNLYPHRRKYQIFISKIYNVITKDTDFSKWNYWSVSFRICNTQEQKGMSDFQHHLSQIQSNILSEYILHAYTRSCRYYNSLDKLFCIEYMNIQSDKSYSYRK